MTRLRSIRLRGFKTFARPTELLFEPGVTVIIGPNGSGKSNIADAVLWVLGEQSPGNLRGRSMQDVLYSGPDGRKSSAVAEVTLVFESDGDLLPVAGGQLEVTRRLVRDSGSEYLLNGTACRLLDVQDLVAGLGIGREMHSVISQGKVEALLNSTAQVRRALMEEAAGLGRFKKRQERAQSKLERTRQNLLRVGDVEREVRSALRPLKQQVVAAERFAEATEDWALARAKWVLLALVDLEGQIRQTEGELARLRTRRAEIETALANLRRQRAADEGLLSGSLEEREEMNSGYHRVRTAAERLEGRAVSLRERMVRAEGELDRARRRLELAGSESASLASRLEEVNARTADESRLQRVAATARSVRTSLEESLPEYRAAIAEEDDLKDSVFELEAARSRALQDRDFLRRELDEKKRVGSELALLLEAASVRLEDLRTQAAALEDRVAAAEGAWRDAEEALNGALAEREEARSRVEQASREEVSLGEQVAGLESRRAVLEDLLARREGTPPGARQLMADIGGSRLVTELLTVEPGYERAFAAALGSLVQAVVVPGPPDIGRVLGGDEPMEAIWEGQPADAPPLPTPPLGARDLWEVVSGSQAVIATLKSLMPPTAVLSTDEGLEEAARAGREDSWQLVTRSGELAHAGLHIARRRELGAEALLKARNELESVAAQESALHASQDAVRKLSAQAGTAMARAESGYRECEECLREAERQIGALRNESELITRRIEESDTQCAELHARQVKEKGLAEKIMRDLESVEQASKTRDAELDGSRASLRVLQGRLETMRKTVAVLEEKKGQAALLEVRLRERCRAHESERERVRAQRENALLEVASYERRVSLLSGYVPVLSELLSVVEELSERSHAAAAQLASMVDEARARSEGAARVMRDWGGTEMELQREYDGTATEMAQSRVNQAHLEDRRSLLETELAELRRRHLSPRALTPSDVAGEDGEALVAAVERAERRRERIGPVNPLAERECAELEERGRFLAEQRRDLESSSAQLKEVIAGLDEHIEREFTEVFDAAKENFSSVISTVFPGAKGILKLTEPVPPPSVSEGTGEELLDEEDSLESRVESPGIGLEVRFPNKAPRSLSLLSGGEKAMTAIAFLFSLFLARPCPFYILDEVEASLDDVNIRRFLALIRDYRDRTQFIVITHQRQTMEVADTLYGVAIESDGTSRVLSRRLGDKKRGSSEATGSQPQMADALMKGA